MIGVFITQLIPRITKTYVCNSLEGSFELSYSLIKFIYYLSQKNILNRTN